MADCRIAGCLSVALLVLSAALINPASAADYAPLDCKAAGLPTERTICSDYGLGQNEARVATLYQVTTSLVAMGQRGSIQDDQRAFLQKRDACGSNAACIRSTYTARDKQLEAVMRSIQQRGPF